MFIPTWLLIVAGVTFAVTLFLAFFAGVYCMAKSSLPEAKSFSPPVTHGGEFHG